MTAEAADDVPAFDTYGATVDAGGAATVTVRPPYGEVWTVSQVSIEMDTTAAGSTCTVRKNGSPITPMVPQLDAAGGDPPVTLLPSDRMSVEWTGCTPGAAGRVALIYSRGRW